MRKVVKDQAWRELTRERRRAARRKWLIAHPEEMKACRDRWRRNNLDRILQKRRERVERLTGKRVFPRRVVSWQEKRARASRASNRWYHANKHRLAPLLRARSRRYHLNRGNGIGLSPEQWQKKLQWQKQWRSRNRDRTRIYNARAYQNPQFAIKRRACTRIASALRRKNIRKTSKTIDLIGCTWAFLKAHIENQFVDGMSWENRYLWHVDHIRPCASFDLTYLSQQLACFHFSNLQPLWSVDNMAKGCKWEEAA